MEQQPTLGADGALPPAPEPAQIARRVQSLPPLSTAQLKLAQELGEARSNAADLERILKSDPALAANVLRLANSAAFRGVKAAATLKDAVVRLGRRGLQGLVLGGALKSVLPSRLDGYGQSGDEFLRHSLGVAALSERIAQRVQFVDRDTIFLSGLLHDVGKLVVSTWLVDMGTLLLDGAGGRLAQEQAALGIDHCAVGQEIVVAWRLPQSVMIVNRFHHEPLTAPDPVSRKLACVVHLADQTDKLLYKDGVSVESCLPDPAVFERLGLRPSAMGELASEVMEEVDGFCEALG
jgi:putative nucleotidyltransferase with HDIG domain